MNIINKNIRENDNGADAQQASLKALQTVLEMEVNGKWDKNTQFKIVKAFSDYFNIDAALKQLNISDSKDEPYYHSWKDAVVDGEHLALNWDKLAESHIGFKPTFTGVKDFVKNGYKLSDMFVKNFQKKNRIEFKASDETENAFKSSYITYIKKSGNSYIKVHSDEKTAPKIYLNNFGDTANNLYLLDIKDSDTSSLSAEDLGIFLGSILVKAYEDEWDIWGMDDEIEPAFNTKFINKINDYSPFFIIEDGAFVSPNVIYESAEKQYNDEVKKNRKLAGGSNAFDDALGAVPKNIKNAFDAFKNTAAYDSVTKTFKGVAIDNVAAVAAVTAEGYGPSSKFLLEQINNVLTEAMGGFNFATDSTAAVATNSRRATNNTSATNNTDINDNSDMQDVATVSDPAARRDGLTASKPFDDPDSPSLYSYIAYYNNANEVKYFLVVDDQNKDHRYSANKTLKWNDTRQTRKKAYNILICGKTLPDGLKAWPGSNVTCNSISVTASGIAPGVSDNQVPKAVKIPVSSEDNAALCSDGKPTFGREVFKGSNKSYVLEFNCPVFKNYFGDNFNMAFPKEGIGKIKIKLSRGSYNNNTRVIHKSDISSIVMFKAPKNAVKKINKQKDHKVRRQLGGQFTSSGSNSNNGRGNFDLYFNFCLALFEKLKKDIPGHFSNLPKLDDAELRENKMYDSLFEGVMLLIDDMNEQINKPSNVLQLTANTLLNEIEHGLNEVKTASVKSQGIQTKSTKSVSSSSSGRSSKYSSTLGGRCDSIKNNWNDNELKSVSSLKISHSGVEHIKQSEGIVDQVYDDATGKIVSSYDDIQGYPTIGIGHLIYRKGVIDDRDKYEKYLGNDAGIKMTKPEIDALFLADLNRHLGWVSKIKAPITQNMYDALADYAFNAGSNAAVTDGIIKLINKRKYEEAFRKLCKSRTKGGKLAGRRFNTAKSGLA